MHMADALVKPVVGGSMFAFSGAAAAYSIYKIRNEEDFKKKIPTMGVMGAFVFATQMINFTIPGTGSSGHLCGGLLLSSILGPYAGFLSMIGVLLIQCLFFADGGLLALGANVWNMAFYGCFLGAFIWKLFMKNGMSKKKIIISSILGSILTLQLGAFSVTLETLLSGITVLPFKAFLLAMQPIHLAIGAGEGIITAAVLCFIYETRPEMLWTEENSGKKQAKLSYKKVIIALSLAFIVIAGGLSLFASSYPDGLEWSIENLTGDTEITAEANEINELAASIQDKTSFLPDYAFKNSDTPVGTSVAGIVGSLIVCGALIMTGYVVKLGKNRRKVINE